MREPRDLWVWLVGPRGSRLTTDLDVETCLARLSASVDSWFTRRSGDVVGQVGKGQARFRRSLIIWRNDFRSEMRLQFSRAAARTMLICQCGLPVWTKVFNVVWSGMVLLFGLGSAATLLDQREPAGSERWELLSTPLAMLGFMVVIVLVGRLLSLGDDQFPLSLVTRKRGGGPLEERPAS